MEAFVEQRLWLIKTAIEPTETQKEGARRSHLYLRELLNTGNIGARITESFLSGSYSRDTAIKPIDDVDIIFTINPTFWDTRVSGLASLFGQIQQRPNERQRNVFDSLLEQSQPRPNERHKGLLESLLEQNQPSSAKGVLAQLTQPNLYPDPYPNPTEVLEFFSNAIRYRYPVSSLFNQRRSVRLSLNHLDIDVVPAISLDQNANIILIPDSDDDKWVKSAPKLHAERATNVNTLRGGRFKPLVKLLKSWNGNIPSTARFKSFCIETMATRIFYQVDFQTLSDGLLYFWDFCAGIGERQQTYVWKSNYGISSPFFSPGLNVPDTAGLGTNIASDVDLERKMRFGEYAARSRDRLMSARRAMNQDSAINHLRDAMYIG